MQTKIIETGAGRHISSASTLAVAELAKLPAGWEVSFDFNGTKAVAREGDTPQQVEDRWHADFEAAGKAHRESPEYKEAERVRAAEDAAKRTAHLTESASTEKELREAGSPWPYTMEQLTEYVNSLVDRQHDYGSCVYAMSLAATAAFNFVAQKLGTTGFQSSCADLDFIRRSRHIEGPFMLIKGEDALYPQYDLQGKLEKALQEWAPWMKEEAAKRLASSPQASLSVLDHWRKLAGE